MFRTSNFMFALTGILALFLAGTMLPRASAWQKTQKAVPKQERSLALGEDEVKQLIALMDTDKNGKISRQEFMNFMAAEFDRLDKDKNGELDQKELTQSLIRPARPNIGK